MKTKFTLLTALLIAFTFLQAQTGQVPNGGFETWTGPGLVTGWATMESVFAGTGLSGFTFKDSTDKIEGLYSAKIVSDSVAGQPSVGIVSGFVSTGTGVYTTAQPIAFTGIPFSHKPDTLEFDYQYSTPGSDSGVVLINMSKAHTILLSGGAKLGATPTNVWAKVKIVLTAAYASNTTPDSLLLQFFSSQAQVGVLGSTLHVDGVRFGYKTPSAIDEVAEDISISVYPNPTSGVITIGASKDLSGHTIEIFNLTGQVVLKNVLTSDKMNVGSLANGTYIYRITDKEGITIGQNKLVILK